MIFEIDSMGEADSDTRQQALGVVGDVVRRTLRESDAACRLGDLMVGAILEDTPEAGAVWAAERVRGTLLASPIGDALTLSAGRRLLPDARVGCGRAGAPGELRARRSPLPRAATASSSPPKPADRDGHGVPTGEERGPCDRSISGSSGSRREPASVSGRREMVRVEHEHRPTPRSRGLGLRRVGLS